MKQTATVLFFFFLIFLGTRLQAATYPGVLFENSTLSGYYTSSKASSHGESWIYHINGHLPVSDSVYFTPVNALLLRYRSAAVGAWQSEIRFVKGRSYVAQQDEVLSFKLFVQSKTLPSELPVIRLRQDSLLSEPVLLSKYADSYQENMWFSVDIPLKVIAGWRPGVPVNAVVFSQHARDGKQHDLFVDQIEFLPGSPPKAKLTGQAVLSSAVAYEKHVDLTWQLPLTPSIRYIKIYRSTDKKSFQPVALRPVYYQKYTDVIPEAGGVYYYKIAWVDYEYRESPFSEILEAKTRILSDDELLQVIQLSHINYFVEGLEINSGMHRLSNAPQNAGVSVKHTGAGILALIVGAERKALARETLLQRINKIVEFLSGAERFYGAWPAFLNGRTGKAIVADPGHLAVDLEATAFLMQGLLCARQYFDGDNAAEKALREKITALWHEVNWNGFTMTAGGTYLFDSWSPITEWEHSARLSGYNTGFVAYLLSMASPTHAVPADAYYQGYARPLSPVSPDTTAQPDDLIYPEEQRKIPPVATGGEHPAPAGFPVETADTVFIDSLNGRKDHYRFASFTNDTVYYGVRLAVGSVRSPVQETMSLYLAFDPRNRDRFCDYYQNTTDLIDIHYRKSADKGMVPVQLLQDAWGSDWRDSTHAGRIYPSAAVAAYVYTPLISMRAISKYYRQFGDFLFSEYGFRNAFNLNENWVEDDYDAMNQALIAVNIENARSGLIWKLFMQDPDIQKAASMVFDK